MKLELLMNYHAVLGGMAPAMASLRPHFVAKCLVSRLSELGATDTSGEEGDGERSSNWSASNL